MSRSVEEPEVPQIVRANVGHAVTRLLRAEELDSWSFRWAADEETGRRYLCVDVVAAGEPYLGFLYEENAAGPLEHALDTFTDGLEDFVSESRFAWGQQRLLTERPWHRG